MGNHVGIACAATVLNYEATGSTSDERSSLQLGLGLAVHNDNHVALEESLVRELGHSLQDVLVSVGTDLDVASLGKTRERTLVTSPAA